jgi:hypothetical protein
MSYESLLGFIEKNVTECAQLLEDGLCYEAPTDGTARGIVLYSE